MSIGRRGSELRYLKKQLKAAVDNKGVN